MFLVWYKVVCSVQCVVSIHVLEKRESEGKFEKFEKLGGGFEKLKFEFAVRAIGAVCRRSAGFCVGEEEKGGNRRRRRRQQRQ